MTYAAKLSECKTYRHILTRVISQNGIHVTVIMVNPSKADGVVTDHTIRKLDGFGNRLGWASYTVVNIHDFRATDIKDLGKAKQPISNVNFDYITYALLTSQYAVVAWGSLVKLPPHLKNNWQKIDELAKRLNRPLYCWGVCNDGQPVHPVMISYENKLEQWFSPVD